MIKRILLLIAVVQISTWCKAGLDKYAEYQNRIVRREKTSTLIAYHKAQPKHKNVLGKLHDAYLYETDHQAWRDRQ